MNASLTEQLAPVVSQPHKRVSDAEPSDGPGISPSEAAFRLGLWLSGLQSFVKIKGFYPAENARAKPAAAAHDWTKEVRLTASALLVCSRLCLYLSHHLEKRKALFERETAEFGLAERLSSFETDFEAAEILELSAALKDLSVLNETFLRAAPLGFGEWAAWSGLLREKLGRLPAVGKLTERAEKRGEEFLPSVFDSLFADQRLSPIAEADLRAVLPRFAKILKWLDAIGEMHRRDEPLKLSLLLFARIHEQIREMLRYVNNRLLRFPNEEDSFFIVLDSAVYAASMEIRKVYNFELANLSELRQVPLIYAKIETSYSLLNDCFQQIVVNFAQFVEPRLTPAELFPNIQTKLEQSLALRRNLWNMQRAVQKAEKNPDAYSLENLRGRLDEFLSKNLRFLFYKDLETVERFVEEVKATRGKKDLVPILHRFGAYLETLLGQVNMRAVLANHPFDFPQDEV